MQHRQDGVFVVLSRVDAGHVDVFALDFDGVADGQVGDLGVEPFGIAKPHGHEDRLGGDVCVSPWKLKTIVTVTVNC